MAEALGVAIAIPTLFRTCIDYFEIFKAAQSFNTDSEKLWLQLDFEQLRLLIWGKYYGLVFERLDFETRDRPKNIDLIEKALRQISSLFKDSHTLRKKYGLSEQPTEKSGKTTSAQNTFLGSIAWKLLSLKYGNRSTTPLTLPLSDGNRTSLLKRTKWAIYDKTKFENLVKDVRKLVTGLYSILPLLDNDRDRDVPEYMTFILPDLPRLKQIQRASELIYPTWSMAASAMIMCSEAGSVAPARTDNVHNVEKFVAVLPDAPNPPKDWDHIKTKLQNKAITRLFLVSTSECIEYSDATYCLPENFGESCIHDDGPSFATTIGGWRRWTLGRRLKDMIDPKLPFDGSKFLEHNGSELDEYQTDILDTILPAVHVKVYCPPCARAIRTALIHCMHSSNTVIEFTVRVLVNFPSSCRQNQENDTIEALHSMLEICHRETCGALDVEGHDLNHAFLEHLDRPWLERAIYELELEPEMIRTKEQRLADMAWAFFESDMYSVFIGEVDDLNAVLEWCFPRILKRPARKNELYQFYTLGPSYPWVAEFAGSFTPSNFDPSPTEDEDTLPL